MDTALPMASLAFVVMTVVNLIKYIRAQDWNGALTILTVWAAGVVSLVLFAQSDWADTITFGPLAGDIPLSKLKASSLLILGLQLGSTGVVTNEFKKAFDSSDSAEKPRLLMPPADKPPSA